MHHLVTVLPCMQGQALGNRLLQWVSLEAQAHFQGVGGCGAGGRPTSLAAKVSNSSLSLASVALAGRLPTYTACSTQITYQPDGGQQEARNAAWIIREEAYSNRHLSP